ncbi:hypothetical protein [Paenibacillus radicis (ex Xue et al. 2023)]|uniref:ABC transporter permease n=1 Tax=Paenibacillus radicis (ex Xue et al. 2023) TaxID=2972489 RepID=A0ABT1YCE6_9BACL|nr:hypothetical protein [Paenibacillus radicis (ex Xue et al. 2023)]MCR8629878.1 hypothetical protein [Paenibacillus radicis (ex Xue et al. 2023)]
MKVWWSLFKKELAFGTRWSGPIWIYLCIVLILGGLSVFLSYRFQSGFFSNFWLFIMYLHFFAPAAYMLISLRKERKLDPFWLQLPLPGWKLLAAKYAAAFVEFVSGLLVSTAFFLWVQAVEKTGVEWLSGEENRIEINVEAQKILIVINGSNLTLVVEFISIAFAMAISLVLLYLTAAALRNRFGRWNWPLAVLLFIAVSTLEFFFEQTAVYRYLFFWGDPAVDGAGSLFKSSGEQLWIWLNMAVFLYLSAWLLDRKVEV